MRAQAILMNQLVYKPCLRLGSEPLTKEHCAPAPKLPFQICFNHVICIMWEFLIFPVLRAFFTLFWAAAVIMVMRSMAAAGHGSLYTQCPRNLDPFQKVNYYIKWTKTSWTYSTWYVDIMYYILLPETIYLLHLESRIWNFVINVRKHYHLTI